MTDRNFETLKDELKSVLEKARINKANFPQEEVVELINETLTIKSTLVYSKQNSVDSRIGYLDKDGKLVIIQKSILESVKVTGSDSMMLSTLYAVLMHENVMLPRQELETLDPIKASLFELYFEEKFVPAV